MTTPDSDPAQHPSPHRGKVRMAELYYGLVAGPVAWILSQIASSALAQEACFPQTHPLAAPNFGGIHAMHIISLSLSLLLGASAAIVALRALRRTQSEGAGDRHTLLAVGEGRSRFMAFAGLLTSSGFMIGTLFSVPAVLFVPAC